METRPLSQVEKNPSATPLPWWLTSKTIYGLIALAVAYGLSKLRGSAVTPEDQAVLALTDEVLALVGAVLTLIGRIHAERKIRASITREWKESEAPIEQHPDLEKLEKLYVPGPGGAQPLHFDADTKTFRLEPEAVRQPLPLVDDAREGGFVDREVLIFIAAALLVGIFAGALETAFEALRRQRVNPSLISHPSALNLPAERLPLTREHLPRLHVAEPVVVVNGSLLK